MSNTILLPFSFSFTVHFPWVTWKALEIKCIIIIIIQINVVIKGTELLADIVLPHLGVILKPGGSRCFKSHLILNLVV
jgi:hypothetical protein